MAAILIALSSPIEHGGKTHTTLTLDVDKLTGGDVLRCERETIAATGAPAAVLPLSTEFQIQLAARACDLPVEVLKAMKAIDFIAVTVKIQGFLMGTD